MLELNGECRHILYQVWPLGPTVAFNPNSPNPSPCSICGKVLSADEKDKVSKSVELMRLTIKT